MDKIKIIVGIAIIIASFVYILKNNTSMLDNMMAKTKKEYERKQAIKEQAYKVVDGQADAFDTIVNGAKAAAKPITDTMKKDDKDDTKDIE